ncbi:MAG: hypothetical protein F8N36_13940 [Desulfovibrio sp.]|uniref:hypothetical protein n=1 Tax=Desulfovibrio sp. TaxID=885 RepID=UPI00135D845A|nr:hypothetical protein [Desulfovibrio sp.]MTJ93940.1 hypothetical protein [Desulfovibrio sp.]
MKQTAKYPCPGDSEFWAIRRVALGLIADIDVDIRTLTLEEEGPYWDALQFARITPMVREILSAHGLEALLTPALGPIPEIPAKSDDDLIAEYFSWEPTDDPEVLADRRCEEESYLGHLADMAERAPMVERIMTDEGIVRIVTHSSDDEESSSFSRKSYLNGELHDIDGQPAVRKSSHHRILSEGYLDEDFEESYCRGEPVAYISHDDRVVDGWCHAQRVAFGAAEFDDAA